MLPIWLLAELTVMIYYWRFWEPWAGSMLVVLLPKFRFWIGNRDWHNYFFGYLCDSLWGEPLLDPKKIQNQKFYMINWIRKKLLVDVTNLATCWTNDYNILLEVLGTLGRIYVSRPVAKTLVLDWKSWLAQLFLDVFMTLCGVNPYWTQKKLQN